MCLLLYYLGGLFITLILEVITCCIFPDKFKKLLSTECYDEDDTPPAILTTVFTLIWPIGWFIVICCGICYACCNFYKLFMWTFTKLLEKVEKK